MRNALKATLIASTLLATAGLASAQQTTTVTSQHISTPERTIKLEIRNGVATMTLNGDEVRVPPLDGDWTTYDIIDESGEVVCTLNRAHPGDYNISVTVADMPDLPVPPGTLDFPRLRTVFPGELAQAQLPGLAVAPEQPKVMLGVRLDVSLDDDDLANFGIDPKRASRINFLIEGAPAMKAGLKVGDILVGIGDRESGNIDAIRAVLEAREPGDTVKVVLLRDGEKITKKVRLTAFQNEPILGIIERGDRDDVRRQLDSLSGQLEEYKAKLAASQKKIASIQNPEKLRAAADEIQQMAMKIAELSRDRAEMLAQIEMQNTQSRALILGEDGEFWNDEDRGQGHSRLRDELRNLLRQDEQGLGPNGGFFIQRDGENGPVIIERRLDLEDVFPEGMQEILEGLVDGHWEEMAGDLVDNLEDEIDSLMEENGLNDLDTLMDQTEDEFEGVDDRFEEMQDRFEEMEDRLERIENLLHSLLDSE